MSRIVEGIKELLKGKDDEPEHLYPSGYDQRQARDANRYYGYPANATSEVRSQYQRPFGEALDDGYRNGYERSELRGEYRKPYSSSEASPRGTDYRRPYATGYTTSEVSPRGDYIRTSQSSPREYRKTGGGYGDSVIEFMVPMCCDKCKEKVREELSEVEGVESVRCDPPNSRVIVTGGGIDIERCLKKAERAVKKKCELISNEIGSTRSSAAGYYPTTGSSLAGSSPTLRPSLGRLPSFASGKVTQYDGLRGQDYEAKDYNGFSRLPSYSKHRHHEAEYITSFDQRPEPRDARRDYYNVSRMPSFNRHRHHDAEYINTGDRDYSPRTFYENNNTRSSYTAAYDERPSFRSQVSFSRLPVENPNYVKHIAY